MVGGGGGLSGQAAPANINVFNIGGANTNTDQQPNSVDGKTTDTNQVNADGSENTEGGEGQSGGGPSIKFYKLSHDQGLDGAKTLELEPDKIIKPGEGDNENSSSGGGKKISF